MQMALQNLAEIMESLRREGDPAGMEKRQATRMSIQGRVQVVPVEGDSHKPFTVLLRDISLTGIGMLQSRSMPPGQQFVVMFPRAKLEPLSVLCVSRFCRELADGLFNVGAAFTKVVAQKTPRDRSAAAAAA